MREDRSSTPKTKKQIINEGVKIMVFYSFKNNFLFTSMAFCLFIVGTVGFSIKPEPYTLLTYSIACLTYSIAFMMLYPFLSDLSFYISYYDTRSAVARLLHSSKKEGNISDLNLELFQINYNRLRKRLKKRIRTSRGNLLTYDYEISRIVQDIDIFFDATTKTLFRRKVMTIPFSPHDAYDKFMEDNEIQSRLADDRWQNIEPPPNEYEFEAWEIKEIDFRTIDRFLQYFSDIIIRKPRTETINTVAIGELFRRWNLIVKKLDESIFEESKKDVEKYYNEKQERRSLLLKMLFELSVLLMVGIISGVLASYFTI
jgi:hypothetical protein